jgi:hypothetical protein
MKHGLELLSVIRVNHGLLMRAIVAADQHKRDLLYPGTVCSQFLECEGSLLTDMTIAEFVLQT